MSKLLASEEGCDYERGFVSEALASIEAWRESSVRDFGPGYFRPMTHSMRNGIVKCYENTAVSMYTGFAEQDEALRGWRGLAQKHIAALWSQAGGVQDTKPTQR